jgi:hypothetical protein
MIARVRRFVSRVWKKRSRRVVRSSAVRWVDGGVLARAVLQHPYSELTLRVRAGGQTSFKLRVAISGDLSGSHNILLVPGGKAINAVAMTALGYAESRIGSYRYLKEYVRDGYLNVELPIDESVEVIHLKLWNFKGPLVLDDLRIESTGAKFSADGLVETGVDKIRAVDMRVGEYLGANFLLRKSGCGAHCISHCDRWFKSMDAVSQRHVKANFGRSEIYLSSQSGELIPANLQNTPPAFLTIPKHADDYLAAIGDKSRNMLRKAMRAGYLFRDVKPEEFENDIFEIRTSDPMRQGRPIPEYYYSNPPLYVLSRTQLECRLHTEKFFGIFLNDKLVSYITVYVFGELVQINQILCHKEHVKNGVMNLNVFHMVERLIAECPWVRAINYLYMGERRMGIDLFKESVGFRPLDIAIYDSLIEGGIIAEVESNATDRQASMDDETTKKPRKKKGEKRDFIYATESLRSVEGRIDETFGRDRIRLPGPRMAHLIRFFSSEINQIAEGHPIGTLFAVPFPTSVSAGQDAAVARYLEKRFKGNPVLPEGFVTAFKGGNLSARAFFAIEHDGTPLKEGVLIVERTG